MDVDSYPPDTHTRSLLRPDPDEPAIHDNGASGARVSNQLLEHHLTLLARLGELLETLIHTAIVLIENNPGAEIVWY